MNPHLPYRLDLDLAQGCWKFGLNDGTGPVLVSASPLLLVPDIAGARPAFDTARIESDTMDAFGRRHLVVTACLKGEKNARVLNEIVFFEDRLVCRSECDAEAGSAVRYWHVAREGSVLNADSVHAYIGSPETMDNGTVFHGATADLSTASHNWLYSPMMPRIMIQRGRFIVGLGGTALAHDYGLNLNVSDTRIDHLRFDYGGPDAPFVVNRPGRAPGPRLQIQVSLNRTFDQAHALFTQAMISDGLLARRTYRPEQASWRRGWYCTFGDQMALAKKDPAQQFGADHFLNEEFVMRAATTIRKHRLHIGTLIIDEGWADKRGDWNLNTGRFPDMRALVDRLHAMDFNVVLWWAPFLVAQGADILKRPGLAIRNARHGHPVLNYTHPETRAYIQEKLNLWFDSGPGGWNLDSLKIDFMAENVHPTLEDVDGEWRGEERLFHHLFRMIHETIVRHKDSPGVLGEAFNPFMAPYCVAFQFEERFDRNLSYLYTRPAMAEALIPGAWYAPHFTYHDNLICTYARMVKAVGGIPQIGKVVSEGITPDLVAELRGILDG